MKKYFSPEFLVARFIKSATNGRTLSVRLRRIITLLIIPFWILGLSLVIYQISEAVSAISELENVEADIQSNKTRFRGFTSHDRDWYVLEERESILNHEKEKLEQTIFHGFASIFYYLLLCFFLPWVILRLTFWIIDADKVKEEVI